MVASALPNLKSLSLASVVPTHADEGGDDPLPHPPQTWATFAEKRAVMADYKRRQLEKGEITQDEYDKAIAALEEEEEVEEYEEAIVARDAAELGQKAEKEWGAALRAEREHYKKLRDYADGVGERDRDNRRRREEEEEQKNAKKAAASREPADLDEPEPNEDERELQMYYKSRDDNGLQSDEEEYEENAPMFPGGQPEGQREDDEDDEEEEEEDDDETQPPDEGSEGSEETQVGPGLPESPKAPAPPPPVD